MAAYLFTSSFICAAQRGAAGREDGSRPPCHRGRPCRRRQAGSLETSAASPPCRASRVEPSRKAEGAPGDRQNQQGGKAARAAARARDINPLVEFSNSDSDSDSVQSQSSLARRGVALPARIYNKTIINILREQRGRAESRARALAGFGRRELGTA